MKKSLRDLKLKLNRETLKTLDQPELGAAAGGITTATNWGYTCLAGSCNTCGSRLC